MTRRARARSRIGGGRRGVRWPAGIRRVTAEDLRWECDPKSIEGAIRQESKAAKAETRALLKTVPDERLRARQREQARLDARPAVDKDEIVGQERALEALAVGLNTEAPGFHLFVTGPSGSGREALVRAALAECAPPLPRPKDRVYVANFRHPHRPTLLTLPRGKGRRFVRDLDDMLGALRRAIPAALTTEQHLAKADRLRRLTESAAERIIEDLAAELRREGLIVGSIPEGYSTPDLKVDVGEGEPLSLRVAQRRLRGGDLRATRKLKARLKKHPDALERLEQVAGEARAIARRGALKQRRIEGGLARTIAQGFADDLARAYPTAPVRRWLDSLLGAIAKNVDLFIEQGAKDDEEDHPPARRSQLGELGLFRANLFVDTKAHPVLPVLFEANPTYQNLFGSLDASEGPLPDHMRLRAGSLLEANGGVIVVDAAQLVSDEQAWSALKRAVLQGRIEVQRTSASQGNSVRPAPIRTAFKVVAIGSDDLYEQLHQSDPDFAQVFKVTVQLESAVARSKTTVHEMARALMRVARRAGLRTPEATALARLLEHSARVASRNDRLQLSFSQLLDILQEADRVAAGAGRADIRGKDVEQAMDARRRRHDLGERDAQEQLDDEVLLVSLSGRRVGVINALVVYEEGSFSYGRPARVTATSGVGREGVVDIEREASFSGDSHHKGVRIVTGLLCDRYAQDKPLCLTASVCFEQSYSSVDGDSASMAETLAILSALGDMPLEQGWGVTGSVNQKGEVQAIGDVNLKVEGFFDACLARGLTGRQGVVIPESNVRDLMLRHDVVKAVARGQFHVVAVRHVDDALELLTGLEAGTRASPVEPYPPGSAHARVDARLTAYAQAARSFASGR